MPALVIGGSLSEQVTKEFLMTKVLDVQLGTADEKGHANIHPTWYYTTLQRSKLSGGYHPENTPLNI